MAVRLTTVDRLLKRAVFAPLGWVMRRNNYDGTAVRPTRNLTWNVPVNLSDELNEGKYPIQIGGFGTIITAIDGDDPVTWKIDLTGAVDIRKVTPAEMAVALNGAINADTGVAIDSAEWSAGIDVITKACNEAVGKANYIGPTILLRLEFQYSTQPFDESAPEKPLYGGLIGP